MFQHHELATKQLHNEFNTLDKIQYLRQKLLNVNETGWGDLGLTSDRLFGFHHESQFNTPETICWNPIIEELSNTNKKFFCTIHDSERCNKFLRIWPNANVIVLINSQQFVDYRTDNSVTIKYNWNDEVNLLHTDKIRLVDNNIYFSENDTLNEIRSLYNELDLSDYNEKLCKTYYNLWIDTIRKAYKKEEYEQRH